LEYVLLEYHLLGLMGVMYMMHVQSYQWRSTSAGEDIISIHPCDPGYAAMGMYYITVTRCLPPSLLPCTTLP
jgi:hypothetical protein